MIDARSWDRWFTRLRAGIRTLEAQLSHPIPLSPDQVGAHLKCADYRGLLSQAISLGPAPAARNYYGRALAFTALGRDAEAREDLERAVELGADRNALTAAIEELVKQR